MSLIAIYITCPNATTAQDISNALLNEQLIACSNIMPAQSMYHWDGAVQNDTEVVCISKSIDDRWPLIQAMITRLHPYDLPCVWKINIDASKAYEAWVIKEVGG